MTPHALHEACCAFCCVTGDRWQQSQGRTLALEVLGEGLDELLRLDVLDSHNLPALLAAGQS